MDQEWPKYDPLRDESIERWARDGFVSPGHLDEDRCLRAARSLISEAKFQAGKGGVPR